MERAIAAIGACMLWTVTTAGAQTLKGSRASVDRQYAVAVQHDYSFLDNTKDVGRFVDLGLLVPVRGSSNFELASVSFPYARPGVRTFVDRLAQQYRAACGERLVITSLTRPTGKQPRNASDQSVHPAGMAVDLRISKLSRCRSWLERTLLALEKQGVLDATKERRPAHYHVALFPQQYLTYVARVENRSATKLAANTSNAAPVQTAKAVADEAVVTQVAEASSDASSAPAGPAESESESAGTTGYRVHRGDTLWSIARRHGTSVQELKELNNMTSSRIAAGQVIVVPSGGQQ
jgi:LysM repeat protein